MEIIPELKELNLDENEIKVYLSCLIEEGANVNNISKSSGLIRTTVYGVLKSLMQKGLISTTKKEKTLFFQSASPKELLNILEEKKQKITSILPQLNQLSKKTHQPQKVQFFEGKNGVKTITNDIISKPSETIKLISVGKKWLEFSESFTSVYYRKKKEMKVTTKTILNDNREEREFAKSKKVKNSEFRFLKGLEIAGTCYIYHDKISFAAYEEDAPRGFIIQYKEFNRLQNAVFDRLWKISKK